jgi:S-adenosylmethionine decarboxylase
MLNDVNEMERVMTEAVRISGATIIRPFFHKFSPQGISGIIVVAESHFSIHTWPEYGYAAVDFFTCGDQIRFDVAVKFIKDSLKAVSIQVMEIRRGTLDVPPEKLRHK